ncbi:mannosyltransferase complex subunit Alg2 [Schizosaccharomyces cryophilus OY26]|uniref:Alpha-1,3/1,6-mannosyltransferase ALG2 n=1 Tax=Schizosaccharomyces cryophilus (strain OY26 / ATCC MYA-4695 / CBS 11777 / NBRC 106824 / NRRL Y48691) TaxID=653667 RepID=S9VMM8_SCHCR|nr:mannosyltransferase complex subunit Alg2 [Schizosaccharomyces cryophilus OY26]EPY49218.1 mannosyltransferase complex subunit Alg2 [Schizosaccharomyces cryophilus OY26]
MIEEENNNISGKAPVRIAFVHPDLGIGGAERLVVDAAVGLQSLGKEVIIYTSHCDKQHCFEEIRDGTLKVEIYGDWLPSSIFGKLSILCSTVRQIYLTLVLLFKFSYYDAIFVDQLSNCIPMLLLACRTLLFYCHFPDKYLVKPGGGILKRLYRVPFDSFEAWSVRLADRIVVNSNFTASVFKKAFPKIRKPLRIIHPCVDVKAADHSSQYKISQSISSRKVLMSVNRYELKKDIALAIESFAALRDLSSDHFSDYLLVVAGGYDTRVTENRKYLELLQNLCKQKGFTYRTMKDDWDSLSVESHVNVLFLLSVPSDIRDALISTSKILLYTPENEHFGIVPLEAMLREVPVLAQSNGGPLETVSDGKTGWLRPRDPKIWGNVIHEAATNSAYDIKAMGEEGRKWVINEFSADAMASKVESEIMSGICSSTPKRYIMRCFHGTVALLTLASLVWFMFTILFFYSLSFFHGVATTTDDSVSQLSLWYGGIATILSIITVAMYARTI